MFRLQWRGVWGAHAPSGSRDRVGGAKFLPRAAEDPGFEGKGKGEEHLRGGKRDVRGSPRARLSRVRGACAMLGRQGWREPRLLTGVRSSSQALRATWPAEGLAHG